VKVILQLKILLMLTIAHLLFDMVCSGEIEVTVVGMSPSPRIMAIGQALKMPQLRGPQDGRVRKISQS